MDLSAAGDVVIIVGMWDWIDILDFVPVGGPAWWRALVLLLIVASIALVIYFAVT